MHAVIHVPLDGVVGSRNCCCNPFAACTIDVTICFIRQTVNVLNLGPLALFCTADTLLIASCLFCLENWLFTYFLLQPTPIVSFAVCAWYNADTRTRTHAHPNTQPHALAIQPWRHLCLKQLYLLGCWLLHLQVLLDARSL